MVSKIAFLFLTITEINHEQIWLDFLKGNEDKYSLYIHSKQDFKRTSPFKKYEMPIKVPTVWEKIANAQIALLKEALKDPLNEKFVYLSESTIPVKSFDSVYTKLMSQSESFMWYTKNPHTSRTFKPLTPESIYKNWTWCVLNRKHAQLMVDDNEYLPIMSQRPFDCEHYPSTFLHAKELQHEIINEDLTYNLWGVPGT